MASVSWPGPRPCRGKEPALSQAPVAVSQRVTRAPLRAMPRASRKPPWPNRERTGCRIVGANRPCRRPSCRVAALLARVSRPSAQRLRALRAQPAQLPSHNTIFCIVAKNQPTQAPQSRYKFCIVTLPSQPTVCNTIFVLQHTSNSP